MPAYKTVESFEIHSIGSFGNSWWNKSLNPLFRCSIDWQSKQNSYSFFMQMTINCWKGNHL
jgi:hypothetical protein